MNKYKCILKEPRINIIKYSQNITRALLENKSFSDFNLIFFGSVVKLSVTQLIYPQMLPSLYLYLNFGTNLNFNIAILSSCILFIFRLFHLQIF